MYINVGSFDVYTRIISHPESKTGQLSLQQESDNHVQRFSEPTSSRFPQCLTSCKLKGILTVTETTSEVERPADIASAMLKILVKPFRAMRFQTALRKMQVSTEIKLDHLPSTCK